MFRRAEPSPPAAPPAAPPRMGRETAGLLLLFFVAIDAVATLLMLRREVGSELNPLMDWLWSHGELAFLLGKMLLTTLAVAWLLRRAEGAKLRFVLVVGFSIYVPIVGLHVFNNWYLGHALVP